MDRISVGQSETVKERVNALEALEDALRQLLDSLGGRRTHVVPASDQLKVSEDLKGDGPIEEVRTSWPSDPG